MLDGTLNIVETPIEIENVQVLDADKWLVTENNEHHKFVFYWYNLYLKTVKLKKFRLSFLTIEFKLNK